MENYKLLYCSVLEIPKIVLHVKTILIWTVNFSDTSSTYSKFKISSVDGETSWFVFKKSTASEHCGILLYSYYQQNCPRVQT